MQLQKLVQLNQTKLTNIDWEIYDHLQNVVPNGLTLTKLAMQCHVSTTTIFRFCKKLGLTGFSELKALLKNQELEISPELRNFSHELYHEIVDYIKAYDTEELAIHLKKAQDIYLLARSELELRVAKEFQRIFFPLGKRIFILPNEQALKQTLFQMREQILWVFSLDSNVDYPFELRTAKYMEKIYTIVLSELAYVPLLANEQVLLPLPSEALQYKLITPYILTLELLYLKLQLK